MVRPPSALRCPLRTLPYGSGRRQSPSREASKVMATDVASDIKVTVPGSEIMPISLFHASASLPRTAPEATGKVTLSSPFVAVSDEPVSTAPDGITDR